MPMGLADRLGDISPRALDDWVNGERDTPACIELSELAAGVKVAELRELAASLRTPRARTGWLTPMWSDSWG